MKVRTAALVLLWLFATAGPARALPEETWLVAIGNNAGDADEVQLLFAERDAREVAEVLRSQGRVASDRVRLLIDERADTVRRTLLAINAAIRARVQEGSRATALLVFYSGHADADALHLRGTRLSFEEIRGLAAGSPATMRLLIIDACRSGAVTRVKGVRPAPEFALRIDPWGDRVEAEGTVIISSSTAGESSQESDRLRASFFSHHLINALRGAADRNGDGRVTLSEAYAYTYTETLRSSGRTLALQHPTYAYDVRGSGDLVLTTLADAGQGAGRLRLSGAGTYLITEEKESGAVVAELFAPRDRAYLSLPRGRYFVQQRGSDEYREYQVTLGPGREVALSGLPYRSVRYDRLVRRRGGVRRQIHGLTLLVGGRGQVLLGEGPTPHPVLGYHVDLPWLTLGLRLSGTSVSSPGAGGTLPRRRDEAGLQLLLQRYVDLPWLSLSFGVAVEGSYHGQTFSSADQVLPRRHAVGLGFSGLFALERQLYRGLGLRVEGGPVALLLRRGLVQDGAETGSELDSAFTWWIAGGLGWRI
jgi:hypothetical protein